MADNQPQMTEAELKLLGARIRQLREKHCGERSLSKVAKATGVSHSAVSLWESGANAPSLAALLRLAQAIGVKPSKFLDPF